MFDDKTYENIMEEMLSQMPDDVNTEEGSLIWNACSKQALQLEKAYLSMMAVDDNLYVSTKDDDHLILYGEDKGVPIKKATYAVVKGVFEQEIEIDERFSCNTVNFIVTEQIEEFTYKLECEEAGSVGNIASGELEPIEYIDDYLGGRIEELISTGANGEEIEVYRKRLIALNDEKYFGGNRADYIRLIGGLDGVGAVKVRRRMEGDDFIRPIILATDFSAPAAQFAKEVQDQVDPETSSGEGDGMVPIGHKVIVEGAKNQVINIHAVITYDDGYTQEGLQSYMEKAVDAYFLLLCKEWSGTNELIVRIAQIESRLLAIDGILDITETTLNDKKENLTVGYESIPKRGLINDV